MKYMIMLYGSQQDYDVLAGRPSDKAPMSADEVAAMHEYMGSFHQKLIDSGEFVDARGLTAPVHARRVQLRNGAPVVTDGPYPETQEVLAGYTIVDCESFDCGTGASALPSTRPKAVPPRAARPGPPRRPRPQRTPAMRPPWFGPTRPRCSSGWRWPSGLSEGENPTGCAAHHAVIRTWCSPSWSATPPTCPPGGGSLVMTHGCSPTRTWTGTPWPRPPAWRASPRPPPAAGNGAPASFSPSSLATTPATRDPGSAGRAVRWRATGRPARVGVRVAGVRTAGRETGPRP